MPFCLSLSFWAHNPVALLGAVAFITTFVVVVLVDGGGFGDPEQHLIQVQPAYGLSSLVDLRNSPQPEDVPGVNWQDYAYVQYATQQDYLCNAVMLFDQLEQLHTRADRVLIYPTVWGIPDEFEPTLPQGYKRVKKDPETTRLLRLARDKYRVRLAPSSELQYMSKESTWRSSFTKLLAFNQTDYKRVLSLDSDAYVLRSLDDLFLRNHTLPNAVLAAPRAYWEPKDYNNPHPTLTSGFMLIEPSYEKFQTVLAAAQVRPEKDYDMDVINDVFKGKMEVLPHRGLSMLTAELRETVHWNYLDVDDKWDGRKEIGNVAYLHFSDWPFPKVSANISL